jgi:hypothetical protein
MTNDTSTLVVQLVLLAAIILAPRAKTKTEKQAPRRHGNVGRRPKLLREITCQFHQPSKTSPGEIIS